MGADWLTTQGSDSRRAVLRRSFSLALASVLSGCGGGGGSGGSGAATGGSPSPGPAPLTNPQPMPSGFLVPANAIVTAQEIGSVGSQFLGLSFEKSALVARSLSLSNTALLARLKELGPSLLRIGGNSVDSVMWVPDGAGGIADQISKRDIESFAAFVKASGWQVIYGLNLAQNTPAAAAEEAAYAAAQLGTSLYCFSLGNEPDLFRNVFVAPDGTKNWTYALFKSKWETLRSAVLARVPNAQFCGPDAADNLATYVVPFAKSVDKTKIRLLTHHHYRIHDADPKSIAFLLAVPDSQLVTGSTVEPARLPVLKSAAQAVGVPFRLTEVNSAVDGGVVGVSDVYASALWVLDLMLTVAKGGGEGVNFHSGGLVTYSPFGFAGSQLTEIRPAYYGYLLFKQMGQGALVNATIDAGGGNISIYAMDVGGRLNVLLVNKEATSFKVTLQLPRSSLQVTAVQLSGPGLTSKTGIDLQGASVSVSNGLGAMSAPYTLPVSDQKVTFYAPAISAVLLTVF